MSSLERSVELLRALAKRGGEGVRLQDLAEQTGIARPTVHRLLATLHQLGLVDQDQPSERYHLGLDLYLLGQAAAERYDLLELARPIVESLAADTGDTAYLTVRHRYESVCILRAEGGFPIKAFTTNVGDRQPMGLGAGSIALLAFLGDTEIEAVLQHNRAALEPYSRFDMNGLLTTIAQARTQDFVLRKSTVVDGITAIGVPVLDYRGRPLASISLTAIDDRMTDGRLNLVAQRCREAAQELQTLLTFSNGDTNEPRKKET
jgi:DNA-binding IclR family transcriptional regulator